jgi:GT2 family glycosyltransferase
LFIAFNHENRGYSAGNNVGIRLAELLQAEAVLIANPDMRIEDPFYLRGLADVLFSDSANYVVGSRIVGLDGKDQGPLREPDFWEEVFWPRLLLSRVLPPRSFQLRTDGSTPMEVPKVSGCCLLIRASFLLTTNGLDENVFLYCEEPILSARVRAARGRIVHAPMLKAVHAHVHSDKGNASRRMLLFIRSRLYYLDRYSGQSTLRLIMLRTSYFLLALIHRINALRGK